MGCVPIEKIYKLINVSKIATFSNKILLIDDSIYEIEPFNDNLYLSLQKLMTGCAKQDIEMLLGERDSSRLLKKLESRDFISIVEKNVMKNSLIEKQWYYLESLNKGNPFILQNRISSKTVCIIGAGGVGNVVMEHLVRAGVTKLFVIDFDVVHISNLNRQLLFDYGDVGQLKIKVVYDKLKKINSKINISTYKKKISNIKDMKILDNKPIDIVVNAADTPSNIENIIHMYCEKRNVASISCSVGRNYGNWGPLFIPGKSISNAMYRQYIDTLMSDTERYVQNLRLEPLEVSFGPTNTIVSTFMAKDIIMYLCLGYDKTIKSINACCGIDFKTLGFKRSEAKIVKG